MDYDVHFPFSIRPSPHCPVTRQHLITPYSLPLFSFRNVLPFTIPLNIVFGAISNYSILYTSTVPRVWCRAVRIRFRPWSLFVPQFRCLRPHVRYLIQSQFPSLYGPFITSAVTWRPNPLAERGSGRFCFEAFFAAHWQPSSHAQPAIGVVYTFIS